ncbi:hypothetical protein C8A01DRAFT_12648 [Parachaetomium inaequale]|uniref:Uncharacterized protein n=1 Tax=Parachaetomium inaequale TaxID=2588326 RepID=A0AAN6PRE9_9PEZI|nr:hypothetical protein C8A01DRAFT_12648 [Parachaetomium inaequale]
MLGSRTLATLSPLRHASKRLPPAAVPVKHVRFAAFVNVDDEELGGVGGSEPPGPQRNPVNWKAGTITAVGVLLAGWWMLRSKSKRAR